MPPTTIPKTLGLRVSMSVWNLLTKDHRFINHWTQQRRTSECQLKHSLLKCVWMCGEFLCIIKEFSLFNSLKTSALVNKLIRNSLHNPSVWSAMHSRIKSMLSEHTLGFSFHSSLQWGLYYISEWMTRLYSQWRHSYAICRTVARN